MVHGIPRVRPAWDRKYPDGCHRRAARQCNQPFRVSFQHRHRQLGAALDAGKPCLAYQPAKIVVTFLGTRQQHQMRAIVKRYLGADDWRYPNLATGDIKTDRAIQPVMIGDRQPRLLVLLIVGCC